MLGMLVRPTRERLIPGIKRISILLVLHVLYIDYAMPRVERVQRRGQEEAGDRSGHAVRLQGGHGPVKYIYS